MWASHAGTRIVDGTEPDGRVTSGTKESRTSAPTLAVRCVLSSRTRSISGISRGRPVGGGSGPGSTLRRLHQSSSSL